MTLFLFTLIACLFTMKGNFMRIVNDSSILANRIRTIRNSRAWTQNRLAEEINVHPTYVSRIESCKKLPTFYIISRIAEVFEIETYELLLNEENLDSCDYKRKKIISILKESTPSNIDIYFPLINALHRHCKRNKRKK